MPIALNVNIDKINKKKFSVGRKGRYLDLILWETPGSDFGDYLVKQNGKKGEKMPILGNGKIFKLEKGNTDAGDTPTTDPW